MQFLTDTVRAVSTISPFLLLGYLLLGALLVQVSLLVYASLKGAWFEREERRLSRERLELLIKEAKLKCAEAEQTRLGWKGFRKFQVLKKEKECENIFSFYLAPHDRKSLPGFKPGQYLTFQLPVSGQPKPVVRCYSLSDALGRKEYYRVTIKRELPPSDRPDVPPGIASSYFCDRIECGDILDVKAPSGGFCLDVTQNKPLVLIAGGVGVTPMLSMLNAIIDAGTGRETWCFFGFRNRKEHIQKEYLERIASQYEHIHLHVCYSQPGPDDQLGRDYQHAGRVSVELMKTLLPSSNYDFFICGPGPLMKSITDGLREWGVPDKQVRFEAFGPASVQKAAPPVNVGAASGAAPIQIRFSRTGKELTWNPAAGSLLEFARDNGVKIDSGCMAGDCGSCLVAIKSGSVSYLKIPGEEPEQGSCLTCICKPQADLVLDA